MNRFLCSISIMLFTLSALFTLPASVRASEGDEGHGLEVEVNGYHVTLDSQNEWTKGENVLVVTITDSMDMPLSDADVEILIAPTESGHSDSESDSHTDAESQDTHGMDEESPTEEADAMPGMDMGNEHSEEPEPGVMKPVADNPSGHDEEASSPIAMTESEHGTYTVQTHLETSGEQNVHVYFHVNGEMLQADFIVEVAGSNSKSVVLWSFAAINVVVVAVAGVMKKQKSLTVKGAK